MFFLTLKPDGLWGTDPMWIKTTKQGESQPQYFYYQNDHLGHAIPHKSVGIVNSA